MVPFIMLHCILTTLLFSCSSICQILKRSILPVRMNLVSIFESIRAVLLSVPLRCCQLIPFLFWTSQVTFRILLRWAFLVFVHCCILYFGTVFELSKGGGISSAYNGLMDNSEYNIGDGEGGDLRR
jgi:hypothetical protein